jgi:hemerythrin-like domain-containing protein
MNAIEELKHEHEAVRLTLKILEKIAEKAERTGTLPDAGHLDQLFDFFATFVDRCHHGKEEELLFPALERVGISREGGPIGVMLAEHQNGRDLVMKMKALKHQLQNGDTKAISEFKTAADAYIRLLDYHIEKENNILFPMAQDHLSQGDLEELKTGFDTIETEKIGAGKHEAFHKMIEEFEKFYL